MRHIALLSAVGAALLLGVQPACASVLRLAPSSDIYARFDRWAGGYDYSIPDTNPQWNGAGHYYSYDSCCGSSAGWQWTVLGFDTSRASGAATSAELFVYITAVSPGQPGSSVTVGANGGNFGNLLTHGLGWYGIDVTPILPFLSASTTFTIAFSADVNNAGVSVEFGAANSPYPSIMPYLEVHSGESGVPELSTWAMMFAGFVGLGFLGFRRKNDSRTVVTHD